MFAEIQRGELPWTQPNLFLSIQAHSAITYSRTNILPRAICLSLAFCGPPSSILACSSFILAIASLMATAFSRNSAEEVSTVVGMTERACSWRGDVYVAAPRTAVAARPRGRTEANGIGNGDQSGRIRVNDTEEALREQVILLAQVGRSRQCIAKVTSSC
jgi:hypothetical protein